MPPVFVSRFTATSCIGRGLDQSLAALLDRQSGLKPCAFQGIDINTWVGEVDAVDDEEMEPELRYFNCRNNRLAQLALRQDGFAEAVDTAASKWGRRRIGVFLGTSTAGILQTEWAFRHLDPVSGYLPADFVYAATHSPYSLSDFIRRKLRLEGPAMSVSSACSSSAKVLASAKRMLDAGLIDAAVVGGVDSLCATTLYGFHSLGLLADGPCRPFSDDRKGISLGEAAAYLLLERMPDSSDSGAVLLLGVGESSDAYHMSSPHPNGLGARMAMEQALSSAGLSPASIDYINLHGTATLNNDSSEAKAVAGVFGATTPCSSTKGATGHTLGAAGALEAVICAIAIQHDLMPAGPEAGQRDTTTGIQYLMSNQRQRVSHVLSNSFGFGGSNCSLVFGRSA
ncbi:beta-ketoacyl-[acyl-carrier-protein] synthase family protein [Acidithiobacillus ferrooxidans F221]|uniref:beta-ketoacyl-[acyl-carrier-protein] synthase family protein n=1 Tax=Acidithiobacillus ferrooxidans TaxID=920 RepID=UPI001C06976E|nr:beta-ketoacyl-[acyl-carrier-protein] synthase family protein [Acidithiobacillus ferrooxidans]MBU2807871.1 beta-ketoacyl-[acyl-carrier-protein] synthase family protein [Acidithiobacillus ferrooxidans F221]